MDSKHDDSVEELMTVNNLNYDYPDETVVAKSRSLVKSSFNKTTYSAPNEKATCYLSYGDAYIDPSNSYLMLDLSVADNTESIATTGGTEKVELLHGSALNIFDSIVLTSRSGEQIERVVHPNVRQYHMLPWSNEIDYQSYNYSSFDFWIRNASQGSGTDYNSAANTDNRTLCIPLSELGLGCFKPDGNKLLPAKLLAGMRIDIAFADNWFAFTHTNDASAKSNTYSVSNLSFVLDSVVLGDAVLHALNKQAASKMGIPLKWKSWDLTQNSVSSGTSINVSAKNALSLATKACVILCETRASNADKSTKNQLNALLEKWDSQQFRYGSHFYPHQKLTQSATNSEKEFYMNNQYVQNNMAKKLNSVRWVDFRTTATSSDATFYSKPAMCSLESSHLGDLTGVPISSGRSLDFNGTIASAKSFDIYFFVEYIVRCNIYSTKIVVTE